MAYEYKMVPLSKYLSVREGKSLSEALATLVEEIVEEMSNKGWEYYRSDSYTMQENIGCLSELFGKKAEECTYNLLVFRKEK